MYTEGFEQWFKMNKNLVSLSDLNKTMTEFAKQFADQNIGIINDNVIRLSSQLKRLSSIKKPEDFLSVQKDCINENLTAGIETTQKIIHLTLENMEEIATLCGSTATKVTEKVDKKIQKYARKKKK